MTVNPYLGSDGVQPFMDVCREEKKGIFVLVKTSNPSSGEFHTSWCRRVEANRFMKWSARRSLSGVSSLWVSVDTVM